MTTFTKAPRTPTRQVGIPCDIRSTRRHAASVLNLSKDTDANDFGEATHTIPIGPANINDDSGWSLTYDLNTRAWDYIKIRKLDSTDSDAEKAHEIYVFRDCRPQKHTPLALLGRHQGQRDAG